MNPLPVSDQIKAAKQLWSTSPRECLAAFHRIERANVRDEVYWQRAYVVHNEWFERQARGLPPYHCLALNELGFHFTDLAPYRAAAQEAGATIDMAYGLMLDGERTVSEQLFRTFLTKGRVAGTTVFDPEFHAKLDREDLSAGLPRVDFHNAAQGEGPVIYLACDQAYLAFALPMIRSLYTVAPEARCHLHVFNPDRGAPAEFPQLGLSSEQCPAHAGYYHAVRFIRLHELMARLDCPVWLMDVDGLFNTHPEPLFRVLDGFDVALRARPARLEPWNQLNACVVGFNNTPGGRQYLARTAQYLHRFRNFLAWGIDQNAMFCVFDAIKPHIACLGDKVIDYEYRGDGIVWANSSSLKNAHLLALADPSVPIERPIYFERFRKFSRSSHPA
jgi:hypothetical protein